MNNEEINQMVNDREENKKEEYYKVIGNAHPDFLDPEFQIKNLDVIAHWLLNGVPYPEDVQKLDPNTWKALLETYPHITDFVDISGNTKGIHGFMDGKFYISHVKESNQSQEAYTWYDDFEEVLGKEKGKQM